MSKRQFLALFLYALFAVSVGFNTVDVIVNKFAWSEPTDGYWHMNTWLVMDFWNCYALFGMAPLISGCVAAGYLVRVIWIDVQFKERIER